MPARQSCGHPVDIQPEQEQNGILIHNLHNFPVLYLRVFSEIMYTYMYEASKELSRRRLYFS